MFIFKVANSNKLLQNEICEQRFFMVLDNFDKDHRFYAYNLLTELVFCFNLSWSGIYKCAR